MILRSRSSPKFSTTDTVETMQKSIELPTTSQGTRIPGGARLWRMLGILFLISFVLYIILFDTAPEYQESKITPNPKRRQMTIVMNTFNRHDLMMDAIEYYSKCHIVRHIHIIWSEKRPPSDRILAKYQTTELPSVHFDIQKNDSLNNRFKPLPQPYTNGIFSVDDDMRVPCSELAVAYDVWRGSKESIIGFMPRVDIRKGGKLFYRCWWRVWWEGSYSIILTKAALLHHDYFKAYFEILPKGVREFVDKNRNCEDIAMQFLVANMTGLPPIYIKGHLSDKGALNGISTSQNVVAAGHMKQRDYCLNELERFFHRNPLVRSSFFVDLASNRWTNTPSTWYEYISSDLWKW